MIDIDSSKVVDILNSRELEDVKTWLSKFESLEVVSRDGSLTYFNAITSVHPQAMQVSDRFHLLKNLTDYCKEFIKRNFRSKIQVSEFIVQEDTSKDVKLSKLEKIQNQREIKKNELAKQAKNLYAEGNSMRAISKILGLDRKTVKKYIDATEPIIQASKGSSRNSNLSPYKDLIIKMVNKKATWKIIFECIVKLGYKGSGSNLRMYMSKVKKKNITEISMKTTIERKHLISLLYKELDKLKNVDKVVIEKFITEKHELVEIYSILKGFRTLLINKDSSKLNKWITHCKQLNFEEINSFITGIERDINAVKNAIDYKYNNGLAEGTVNKIKVIKRIMFGRCSFDLLRQKVLLL